MDYSFGVARSLYAKAVHPRLLLSPGDVPRLRKLVRAGDGKKIMTVLRQKVRRLVDVANTTPDIVELLAWKSRRWSDHGILIRMGLDDIAMVALLDEDADTIAALKRVFDVCATPRAAEIGLDLSPTAYDMAYHLLSEETRKAYREHAVALGRKQLIATRKSIYKVAAHNITLGAALTGLPMFLAVQGDPGVENLDPEIAESIQVLEAVMHVAINIDGYPEEDTGYGTGVAADLSRMAEILRRAGLYDPYKQCPRYAKFGRAMLHFVQPWGEVLANTGDHGADFQLREFILPRLADATRDPSLKWLSGTLYYTHGMVHPENTLPDYYIEVPLRKGFRTPATQHSLLMLPHLKGEKPPGKLGVETAFRDRGRGIVSFRSGWNPDDTFVVFDGAQRSPGGPGHFHDSCGQFSVTALGEYFAIDNGRYNNGQECHNVVLVDGKPGRSLNGEWTCNYNFGRLTEYDPGAFVDHAAVDSSHQHNCCWAWRHLLLVKGGEAPAYVVTVDDVNKHNDWAEFWWTLNTSPENEIKIAGDTATIRGWRKGNLLDVHFALPSAGSYRKDYTIELSQDVNRASAYNYVGDLEKRAKDYAKLTDQIAGAVYVRPRLIAKVGGYNGRILSLMLPREKGAKPAKVERVPSIDNSFALRVTFPNGVSDTIIWAFEHHLLKADGIDARGNWCVVRRNKAGKVIRHTINDGTSLVVDGKALKIA